MSEWRTAEHTLAYLERADRIPHRTAGEAALLDEMPPGVRHVLDLGSGDGRLLQLVLAARPKIQEVALDFSAPMLERLRERFAADSRVQVVEHDLSAPLPNLGSFDVVISSFAIHHLGHSRKRQLYGEILVGAGARRRILQSGTRGFTDTRTPPPFPRGNRVYA